MTICAHKTGTNASGSRTTRRPLQSEGRPLWTKRRRNQASLHSRGSTSSSSSNAACTGSVQAPNDCASGTSSSPEPVKIPGFMYDPVKKRYFKVVRSGMAPPEHPYVVGNVRAKQVQETYAATHAENVRRARHILRPPLFWRRELGGISLRESVCNIRRRYAYLLQRVGVAFPDLSESFVHDMHVHRERDVLFLGSHGGDCARICVVPFAVSQGKFIARTTASTFSDNAPLTSLCLGPAETVISTYLGRAGRSGSLHIYRHTTDATEPFEGIFQYSPMQTSIWASAVRENALAIGASKQVIVVSGWDRPSPAIVRMHTGSDVFSVALCPPCGHTLVGGCRDGSIRLFDLRAPTLWCPSRHGVVPGMKHPAPVYFVNALRDGWRILSAAFDGSINLWDLRSSSRARAHEHDRAAQAMPVMAFKETPNEFVRLGIAMDEDETVFAAAGKDRRIRFYSLQSSRPFRTTEPLSGYCPAIRWLSRPRGYGGCPERGEGLLVAVHSDYEQEDMVEWWSV